MPLAKTRAWPKSSSIYLHGVEDWDLRENPANPLPQTQVMGAEWVHDVVLGSSQSPEDRKPLENKCRRWDLNPHALAGNGF